MNDRSPSRRNFGVTPVLSPRAPCPGNLEGRASQAFFVSLALRLPFPQPLQAPTSPGSRNSAHTCSVRRPLRAGLRSPQTLAPQHSHLRTGERGWGDRWGVQETRVRNEQSPLQRLSPERKTGEGQSRENQGSTIFESPATPFALSRFKAEGKHSASSGDHGHQARLWGNLRRNRSDTRFAGHRASSCASFQIKESRSLPHARVPRHLIPHQDPRGSPGRAAPRRQKKAGPVRGTHRAHCSYRMRPVPRPLPRAT